MKPALKMTQKMQQQIKQAVHLLRHRSMIIGNYALNYKGMEHIWLIDSNGCFRRGDFGWWNEKVPIGSLVAHSEDPKGTLGMIVEDGFAVIKILWMHPPSFVPSDIRSVSASEDL